MVEVRALKGVDTNVLVRFLVDDDEKQGRRARRLVRQVVDDGESLFVSDIVLCELVWVLTAAYGFSRNVVATTLDGLLHRPEAGLPPTHRGVPRRGAVSSMLRRTSRRAEHALQEPPR